MKGLARQAGKNPTTTYKVVIFRFLQGTNRPDLKIENCSMRVMDLPFPGWFVRTRDGICYAISAHSVYFVEGIEGHEIIDKRDLQIFERWFFGDESSLTLADEFKLSRGRITQICSNVGKVLVQRYPELASVRDKYRHEARPMGLAEVPSDAMILKFDKPAVRAAIDDLSIAE